MHIVLNSFGASISKKDGLFLIGSAEGIQSFPPEKVKSISIGKAAKITSDAVLLAIRHEIDLLFMNDSGMPEGRVWSIRYGSISDIRRAQLDFIYSPDVIPWVKDLLVEKLNNQIAFLLLIQTEADERAHTIIRYAINGIEDHKGKISRIQADSLSDIAATLRGWEGAASRKYFGAISKLLPSKYQFENRSRQPARDYFNAMLNYAYGILYGKVEGALIKAGIDPYAGIFHRDDYNRPALVFDVIERYRMWMDYIVYRLCVEDVLPEEGFSIDPESGAIRIEAFGRRILIQSVNDYLSEIIELNGLERSRITHIEYQQYELAKLFTSIASHRSVVNQ
jgi:CRISPR-associated protein Cas1